MVNQQQEQQSPPESDHLAAMAMMNNLQSTGECYCGPVPVSEQYCSLPAEDDALLWDSLWRLVDGDSCSAGDGSSSGEY
jgi:transcription factor MYB, plant